MWCKTTRKKHKTYEGDAVLVVRERSVVLLDMEGKQLSTSNSMKRSDLATLKDGETLTFGLSLR